MSKNNMNKSDIFYSGISAKSKKSKIQISVPISLFEKQEIGSINDFPVKIMNTDKDSQYYLLDAKNVLTAYISDNKNYLPDIHIHEYEKGRFLIKLFLDSLKHEFEIKILNRVNFSNSEADTTTILFLELNEDIYFYCDVYVSDYSWAPDNEETTIISPSDVNIADKQYTAGRIYFYYNPKCTKEVQDLIKRLDEYVISISTKPLEAEEAIIGIITYNPNEGFYVRDFNITDSAGVFEELDLHYGEGFQDYFDKLFTMLYDTEKGIVFFHGEPGTGKTYGIRNLIKKLALKNKKFLFVGNNIIKNIIDPSFIEFLTSYALHNEESNIVLVIEDAEPLLIKREGHSFNAEGVSNLLNLADGILNDIIKVQIIATCNTDISNIDPAILRPERLLAKCEFKKLDIKTAQKLIEYLGLDFRVDEPMTVSQIYAKKHKTETLYFN